MVGRLPVFHHVMAHGDHHIAGPEKADERKGKCRVFLKSVEFHLFGGIIEQFVKGIKTEPGLVGGFPERGLSLTVREGSCINCLVFLPENSTAPRREASGTRSDLSPRQGSPSHYFS